MNKIKGKDLILIGVIILLFGLLIFLTKKNVNNKVDNNSNNEFNYIILTNASDFFTIEGCVNRYLNVLTNKETDNLMKLLDSEYISKNNITKNNVLSKIDNLDGIYSFNAKKIYTEKIDKYVSNYYVYGLLKKDMLDGNDLGTDYYIIVKMDKERLLFSITPYDGKIFKEEI